jgi:hypothetical protein
MSPEAVEQVVARVAAPELARARAEFHARGGAFEPGEPFYEERIRAFFDWLLIEWEGGACLDRFIAPLSDADEARALGLALRRSMRSLWRASTRPYDGALVLDCVLGGARFVVSRDTGPSARLTDGDVLDGRVLGHRGAVLLAPGPVFHPRQAHAAIDALLVDAEVASQRDHRLLDPLLRMRMRFDRFTSINARHVYRFDALGSAEILAAPWAREGAHRASSRPPPSE